MGMPGPASLPAPLPPGHVSPEERESLRRDFEAWKAEQAERMEADYQRMKAVMMTSARSEQPMTYLDRVKRFLRSPLRNGKQA